jgi:23S rRNA pseudouridine1911/1915/1917 synthase
MPLVTQSTRVTADLPPLAGRVVIALTGLSHNKVRGLFDHGCVTVNDQPCGEPRTPVQVGDEVAVKYDPAQGYPAKRRPWSDPSFSIVYEDAQIIVVNKAAKILTVATERGGNEATLDQRVSYYLKNTGRRREAIVVHRLDRGVSGLLVFAKSQGVFRTLQEQFKAHKPERLYVAIVAGHMRRPNGTFRSHIGTGKNLTRFSTRDESQGELAVTHFEVKQQLADTSVVEVRLETGRRNQIRVHFAEHGHPVIGDPNYGHERAQHPNWRAERIALHAITLGFEHPITGKPLQFVSELPREMERFIQNAPPAAEQADQLQLKKPPSSSPKQPPAKQPRPKTPPAKNSKLKRPPRPERPKRKPPKRRGRGD